MDTSDETLPQRETCEQQDAGTLFNADELAAAERNPNRVVVRRPPALGRISVSLIIVNRMIGTGIFNAPTVLAHGTRSAAYTLVLWSVGAIVAICGVYIFAELGMTIPRLKINGRKQCVPSNGGEKNYLEYLLKKPNRLATTLYGVPFIILGTLVGNALICAESLLEVSGKPPTEATVRGLAIGIVSFSCLLHASWRKGGIYLFNFFGAVKLCMLLSMFVLGLIYVCGALGGDNKTATTNLSVEKSTRNPLDGAYGYAEAFLAILFAIGGFNQATYVLGEVDNPKHKFRITTITTVVVVVSLYLLVNLAYMLVVLEEDQYKDWNEPVVKLFFSELFDNNGRKVEKTFMAFSSFGNIMVQTFTAARVKQEIAKEGILPFTKFFASNQYLRLKRLGRSNADISKATPVGALVLHWVFSALLILVTIPLSVQDSYRVFTNQYSFSIDAIFGFAVGLGLLFLRLKPNSGWREKSTGNSLVSTTAAAVFTIANAFPLIAIWFQPSGDSGIEAPISWYAAGTIGMAIIGVALMYWLVLTYIVPHILGLDLDVNRERQFRMDHGYWVVWNEITNVRWRTTSSRPRLSSVTEMT